MTNFSDRSFQNNLKDYTDEEYLDSNNKLKKEYFDFVWRYVETSISKLDKALDLPNFDYEDISVYTGISGVALTYLKLYEITSNKIYLDKSESLIKISVDNLNRNRISFLCGDAGPLAIAAYVSHLKEDFNNCKKYCERLIKRSEKVLLIDNHKICDELLYGRVGYAYSLLYVRKKISKDLIPDSILIDLFNVIIESGRRLANKQNDNPPLMYEWHEKKYIGAAHGLCGIIYILLHIANEFKDLLTQVDSLIIPTIDFLISCKYQSGNYKSSLDNNHDKLVQFCHGSAGVEFLFNLAFRIKNNGKYLEETLKCGEITWSRGLLRKGYGICHGVAGNGYTLLDLYNLTNDPKWLHRAWMFANWCCTENEREALRRPDHPYSLFEGLLGTIYFLLDILYPKDAKFPAFQL